MSLMVMELMLIPLHVPMKMMYGDALGGLLNIEHGCLLVRKMEPFVWGLDL